MSQKPVRYITEPPTLDTAGFTMIPDNAVMPDYETGLDFANAQHLPTLERHLLGACLADSHSYDDAAEVVEPGDFTIDEHAKLFAECGRLRAEGRQVTVVDLFEHLVRIGRSNFGIFDGNAAWWLHETAELEPIGTRARYYATHIREAAVLRRLRGVAAEIMHSAYKPFGPASEVLGSAEAQLYELSVNAGPKNESLTTMAKMMQESVMRIDDRAASGGRLRGLASGFKLLDEHLAGFRPGQMIVIGARPSVGKTALALNIASNIAKRGESVLFFSLEMPQSEIADRLLSMDSGVSMHKINSGRDLTSDEAQKLVVTASSDGIGGCDLFVDDNASHTPDSMLHVARRAVRKFGIQLIVVDYLQLIRAENTKVNRNEQVGNLARRVKHVARELKVPVICLAQLNREVEVRAGEPRLSDLRDSGEIEQHADAVILLHREAGQDETKPGWNVDAIVAKNRNGPTGKVPLLYMRGVMRFENKALGW